MSGLRPNFAIVAAKGTVCDVYRDITTQTRDDIVVTAVKEKFDTIFVNAPEDFVRQVAARHKARVEPLGVKGTRIV